MVYVNQRQRGADLLMEAAKTNNGEYTDYADLHVEKLCRLWCVTRRELASAAKEALRANGLIRKDGKISGRVAAAYRFSEDPVGCWVWDNRNSVELFVCQIRGKRTEAREKNLRQGLDINEMQRFLHYVLWDSLDSLIADPIILYRARVILGDDKKKVKIPRNAINGQLYNQEKAWISMDSPCSQLPRLSYSEVCEFLGLDKNPMRKLLHDIGIYRQSVIRNWKKSGKARGVKWNKKNGSGELSIAKIWRIRIDAAMRASIQGIAATEASPPTNRSFSPQLDMSPSWSLGEYARSLGCSVKDCIAKVLESPEKYQDHIVASIRRAAGAC